MDVKQRKEEINIAIKVKRRSKECMVGIRRKRLDKKYYTTAGGKKELVVSKFRFCFSDNENMNQIAVKNWSGIFCGSLCC